MKVMLDTCKQTEGLNDGGINTCLGFAYVNLGDYRKAEAAYKNAIRDVPNKSYLHRNLGNTLYLQRRYEEAEDACKVAISLDPKDAKAHFLLGKCYLFRSRFDEAMPCFEKAIQFDPEDDEKYLYLGVVKWNLSKLAEAEGLFKEAIRINPHNLQALEELANLYLDMQNKAGALEVYASLKKLDKQRAEKLFKQIYK